MKSLRCSMKFGMKLVLSLFSGRWGYLSVFMAGGLFVSLLSGCPKSGSGKGVEGVKQGEFRSQRIIDTLKKRASKLGEDRKCEKAEVLRDIGLLELTYNGDSKAAVSAMQEVLKVSDDPWALFVLGLVAETQRFREAALKRYLEVLSISKSVKVRHHGAGAKERSAEEPQLIKSDGAPATVKTSVRDKTSVRKKTSVTDETQSMERCVPGEPISLSRCEVEASAAGRIMKLFQHDDVVVQGVLTKLKGAYAKSQCPEARRILGDILRAAAMRAGQAREVFRYSRQAGCVSKWKISERFGRFGDPAVDKRMSDLKAGGWRSVSSKNCDMEVYSEDGLKGLKELRFGFSVNERAPVLFWINADERDFEFFIRPSRAGVGKGTGGQPEVSRSESKSQGQAGKDAVIIKESVSPDEWPALWGVFSVNLKAGFYEAVLRLPVSLGRFNVQVRVTDQHGRGLDVDFADMMGASDVDRGSLSAGGGAYGGPVDLFSIKKPERRFRPWYDFLKLEWALRNGRPVIGKRHSERMLTDCPRFVVGRLSAADAELRWPFAGLSGARDRAVQHLAAALSVEEAALEAIARRLKIAWQGSRYEAALDLAERGARRRKDDPVWDLYKARVFQDKGWLVPAEQSARAAVLKDPGWRDVWRLRLSIAKQRNDFAAIRNGARRLRELDRSSDIWARHLLDRGMETDALREYRRLHVLKPKDRDLLDGRASVLFRLDRLEEAEAVYRRLIEKERWNPDLRLSLAEVLMARGHNKRAKEVLIKGRDFRPSSAEVRKALGGLGVDRVIEPYRESGLEHVRRYLESSSEKNAKSAMNVSAKKSTMIVLDRAVVRVLPSGGIVQLIHQIIHLRTSADLKKWGHVEIPDGVEALTVRTIKADGSTREPEATTGLEPINLPNLELGDFVEVETMVTRPPLAALRGGFMAGRFFFKSFQGTMRRSEIVVVTPREMELMVDERGDVPPMKLEATEDLMIRKWVAENQPRLERQPHSPPPVNRIPSVRVAAGVSWKTLAGMIDSRQRALDFPSHDMRVLADRLCGSREVSQKVKRVYDWVNENVEQTGSFYEPARQTLARRRGYRLVLVRALLRLCKVPVSTIMVEPVHRAAKPGRVPDLTSYTYPVLRAEIGSGKYKMLFPFMKSIPMGFLPAMLRGAKAIRVTDGPYKFLSTPKNAGKDKRSVDMKVTMGPQGNAQVSVVERLEGWPAVIWRRDLKKISRQQIMQSFQQGRLVPNFPGAEMDGELKVENLDENEKPLVLRYSFRAADFMRLLSGRLVLRRAFFPQRLASTYLTHSDRKAPLNFGSHPDFDLKILMSVPKGFRVEMVSPEDKVESPYGMVARSVRREDKSPGKVEISIKRRFPFVQVTVNSYMDFGEFARRADGIEEIVVVFAESAR